MLGAIVMSLIVAPLWMLVDLTQTILESPISLVLVFAVVAVLSVVFQDGKPAKHA